LRVRKKVDLVVIAELQRLAKLATGKTTASFTRCTANTSRELSIPYIEAWIDAV
jgi:hypothetical protein